MRNTLVLLFLFAGSTLYSQTVEGPQKIGHADWEYIFAQLPEYKQVEIELKTYEQQLQTQLQSKARELEAKYKAFQELPATTPEPVRRDKASELTYLRETMQRFEQDAQTSMQKKQSELVNPILAKIGTAIEAVAKENGYAYIVSPGQTESSPFILFADEKYNIAPLVLKKLGADQEKKPVVPVNPPKRE
jgi:outer membrane protein